MDLHDMLRLAVRAGASDVHLKAGSPPIFRIHGMLQPCHEVSRLSPEEIARVAFSMMNAVQREQFKKENEMDVSFGVAEVGRFRVNIFLQRGAVGMVFRVIPLQVWTVAELNLPPVIEQIAEETRGLVLVTGTTGSGKSTTMAAMIEWMNTHRTAHILTIEDPVEFLIPDKKSIINQREVGVDTHNFARALRSALREDPDVILVGEMRDLETIDIAMTAAETGHLVLSTLHTVDAAETISRIVSVFPPHQHTQIRLQLASILKAIISQRLLPRQDGNGRIAAVEVMRTTSRIREMIASPERASEIRDAIAEGVNDHGMQTFDQSLMALLSSGLIRYEDALRHATNADDFALRVSGVASTSDGRWQGFEEHGPSPSSGAGTQVVERAPAASEDAFEIERF